MLGFYIGSNNGFFGEEILNGEFVYWNGFRNDVWKGKRLFGDVE